jgi:hypothetical protein
MDTASLIAALCLTLPAPPRKLEQQFHKQFPNTTIIRWIPVASVPIDAVKRGQPKEIAAFLQKPSSWESVFSRSDEGPIFWIWVQDPDWKASWGFSLSQNGGREGRLLFETEKENSLLPPLLKFNIEASPTGAPNDGYVVLKKRGSCYAPESPDRFLPDMRRIADGIEDELNISKDPKRCYKKGEIVPRGSVPSPTNFCCEGLVEIPEKEFCKLMQQPIPPVGGFVGVCAACGDGRCESAIEDSCNCPQDCGKP